MNYIQRISTTLGKMTEQELKKELESYKFLYTETLNDIHKIELEKLDFLVSARPKYKEISDDDESYEWEHYTHTDHDGKTWELESIDDILYYVFDPVTHDFKEKIKDYKWHLDRITFELSQRGL